MKTFIKNIGKITLLLCLVFLTNCDDGFDELNVDPDEPTADTAPLNNIFLGVLNDVAESTHNETLLIISDLRGFAFPSGIAAYDLGSADQWGMYSQFKNINELLNRTAPEGAEPNAINHGIARILKVIYFQRLTDLFGAIPYTQATQGLEFPQPIYDSQEFIYKDLANELDLAISEINSGSGIAYSVEVDLVYEGNGTNWMKFANALKLRIGMRMRFVDATASSTIINEALSANLISSNQESWAFKYPGTESSNSSPFFSTSRPGRFVSELLLENLRDTDDPRKFIYASAAGNNNDIYQGQVNGLNVNFDDGAQSVRGTLFWQNRDLPSYLLTYSEVNFLKAEAALAGISGNDANTAFRDGIRASMEQWGTPEADIVTYLATATATLSGSEEEMLEQIAIQKWVALFTNGHEAYAEMRRTGYPTIEQRSETGDIDRLDADGNLSTINVGYRLGITEGVLPRRVEYPNGEKELNPDNLNAAVSEYGDGLLDKIWWDVR